ncbi:MAG TPA: hypothetical protein VGT79_04625 [Xanthomonadaceae bacterium]|nr:hypothetical protein [Xanthomonadaceae bacterium]
MRRWMLCLSVAFPLLALLVLGQDHNWDLQNYHLYNPFAWLHGRLRLDISPAQVQTWHNPLLDVPMYLMTMARWPGALICIWLVVPSIVALYLLLRMYALLSIHPLNRVRLTTLAVFTMGGVGFFAVIGTCLNDAFVAAGILGGLFLLLREDPALDRSAIWCLAGALAGATAGLKLTAAVYCLGLAGFALALPSWRRLPHRLAALLLGGIAGFALTYGYWGTLLFHLHGNPFFPYYNQIFHSPGAPFAANTDDRFHPPSLIDALLIPIRLLQKSQRYSEMHLRDPRLLLGCIAYVALLWRVRRDTNHRDASYVARLQGLAGFFLVAFLAWALQYGIYRYAIPLEMLGCMGFVLLLEWLPQHRLESGSLIACLLAIGMTFPATWGRSHFEAAFVDVRMPSLPRDSMIVLSGTSPLGYAVTALPDDVAAISIENNFMQPDRCTSLQAAAEQRIASHTGPLWLLRVGDASDDDGERDAGRYYGLVIAGACERVATNFGNLKLCTLRRDPRPVLCATPARAPGR